MSCFIWTLNTGLTVTHLKYYKKPHKDWHRLGEKTEHFGWIKATNNKTIIQYRKVPKFSDAIKLCCDLPKIQTKRPKLRVFYQNDANGRANSEDPDQTAPLGAV